MGVVEYETKLKSGGPWASGFMASGQAYCAKAHIVALERVKLANPLSAHTH
jgi:hypothetical protein